MAPSERPHSHPSDFEPPHLPAQSGKQGTGGQEKALPRPNGDAVRKLDELSGQTTDIPKLLSGIATIAGLGGALSLALSVVYDWGFFRALDLRLTTLPSNLSDHVRTAINWLPGAVVAAAIAALESLLLIRRDHRTTETRSRAVRRHATAYNRLKAVTAVATVGAVAGYTLLGDTFFVPLMCTLPSAWLLFAHWLVGAQPFLNFSRIPLFVTIVWSPAVALFIFFYGCMAGQQARLLPSNQVVSIVGRPLPVTVTILRSLDSTSSLRPVFGPWATAVGQSVRAVGVEGG
jgi:hypothetical protein